MSSKTRKFIGPMSVVAMFAVIGALAAFVVLGNSTAQAQDDFDADPGAPTIRDLEAQNGAIRVIWSAPAYGGDPAFTGYSVQYAQAATVPAADAAAWTADDGADGLTAGATRFTITGLTNASPYWVRVAVTLGETFGDYATSAAATTPAATGPTEPTDLSLAQGERGELVVTWDEPDDRGGTADGVTGYIVQYKLEDDEDWMPVPTDNAVTAVADDPLTTDVDETVVGVEGIAVVPAPKGEDTDTGDARTVTLTGLIVGETYDVRVAGQNSVVNAIATQVNIDEHDFAEESATVQTPPFEAEFDSSSTSGSSTVELKVILSDLPRGLPTGTSIALYLEDDYQVPDSIASGAVYFVASSPANISTGDGAPVATTGPVTISTDDRFDGDDDYAIQVVIPDMCTDDTGACFGQNGPEEGQKLTLVFSKAAGIKNPTEAKTYKVGASVVNIGESVPTKPELPDTLPVRAKVTLSDDDNTRGYELTITGSGFNNGTTANAYVLQAPSPPVDCETLVADPDATLVGSGLVGSDDTVAITVEVTVPTFAPGKVNHICMVDGENRRSSDTPAAENFDTFELEASIRAVPSTASSGDTVNIFAQDFQTDASFTSLELADTVVWYRGDQDGVGAVRDVDLTDQSLTNGAATISFEVPGSVGGQPLQGTVRVDAEWGDKSKNTNITVTGSELTASQTDVLPNETITITGNGFGSQTCIPVSDITLDNVAVEVDDDSMIRCNEDNNANTAMVDAVEVSNSGQFVATITLWPAVVGAGTKPKPRWDVHLPGAGNRGGSLAGVFRPLIAGPSGSAVSPRLSGWTARPGICRPSPAPPPCSPGTDCQWPPLSPSPR